MILLEPITIFSSIPVNYSQKCNGCHQSFLNVSRFLSTCIKLDSLYNNQSHCDLKLPILCDRLNKFFCFTAMWFKQHYLTLPILFGSVKLYVSFSSSFYLWPPASLHSMYSTPIFVFRVLQFFASLFCSWLNLLHLLVLTSFNTAHSLSAFKILLIKIILCDILNTPLFFKGSLVRGVKGLKLVCRYNTCSVTFRKTNMFQ